MRPAPLRRRVRIWQGLAVTALALGGCSRANDQPGAISADDQRQLNEAAQMLDANSVDLNSLPPANESQPQ